MELGARAELEAQKPAWPRPPTSLILLDPPEGVIPARGPTVTLPPGHRMCEQRRNKSSGYHMLLQSKT